MSTHSTLKLSSNISTRPAGRPFPCHAPARTRARIYAANSDSENVSRSIESDSASDSEASTSSAPNPNLKLPKIGYFSIADTKAEVYSRAGEKFDPAKKGGRYKPEFIWNTDWQTALEREESLRRKQEEAKNRPKEPTSGFLSLSRVAELDRMDVDLSDVLARKRQEEAELKEAVARQAKLGTASGKAGSSAAAPAPRKSAPAAGAAPSSGKVVRAAMFTRKEAARLDRTSRSAARTAVVVEVPALDAEKARLAEEERVRYDALKVEQQLWTLAFTAAGFAMTYTAYTPNVAYSYLVGALGGFAYLRLLSKSVDAVGGDGGLASGASNMASQPRLLIPIILGLGYNRWNQLYAEQLGVTLELLPMLVGFFTYKIAVITRQYKDVFDGKL
ncbi:hypothetical protein HYH02_013587 [Chlamydomonas schloesseri]|uniref:CGL160/ATPI domain-containing protein n=1 Tax=Chlamydomonas schloesseri TaxID=2026947 RepID=A0A835SPC7_9CHLO|nr:hypothetical protein HYH02_013587 [Chlamydomonas schloesseri]|eukprot:KAG2430748.1 hypothetical protein HYH02_013587 [Chlamydomonas schloesseri]